MWKASEPIIAKLQRAAASQYRIVYLMTWEEERVEKALGELSGTLFQDSRPIIEWTAARGFYTSEGDLQPITDPEAAVQHIASQQEDAVYLMKDLPAHFEKDNVLPRMLRDLYTRLTGRNTLVVLSHPVLKIPEVLKKEIFLIELGLPDDQDIFDHFKSIVTERMAGEVFPDKWIAQCASAMRGLTLNEVRHLVLRLLSEKKNKLQDALEDVYDEKAQVLLKESCLRVVPVRPAVSALGGLENLKEWVHARGSLFTKEAHDAGVPMPSGVLFMGVSGCGKSLAAKAISMAWGLQLVRLDMNLILSGVYGPPEFAFDRACRIAESVAPVVLWIDEIENAFGYDEGAGGGGNINIFSSFLTWMQEKPASVFVAATANRIHKLPAEMIRKGRFDQLFFLDLPSELEREEIFRIHIQRNGGNPDEFDMGVLATLTQGRSGAEIEQAVKAARVDAFTANRAFTQRDISRNSSQMVPLSKTMHEQIKQLRDWSYNRATPASKKAAR